MLCSAAAAAGSIYPDRPTVCHMWVWQMGKRQANIQNKLPMPYTIMFNVDDLNDEIPTAWLTWNCDIYFAIRIRFEMVGQSIKQT